MNPNLYLPIARNAPAGTEPSSQPETRYCAGHLKQRLTRHLKRRASGQMTLLLAGCLLAPALPAATPHEILAGYAATAASTPSAARGQQFFTTPHGKEWTCASCHGNPPTQTGKHAATGKTITPLAPAANPKSLTDAARVEKWLRRNCNDVAGRDCSASEKADLMAWLLTVK